MRQHGGCNVISFCLVRKEETTPKLLGNTAVDHFWKKLWKNKRLQNLTAEGFLVKIMGRDGSLKSHGWQSLCFGSVCASSPRVPWSLLITQPGWSSPVPTPSHSLSTTFPCSTMGIPHNSLQRNAAGIRARSPHCPHQVCAQRAPDTPWPWGRGHLRAWARCSQGKQRHGEEQSLAIPTYCYSLLLSYLWFWELVESHI